MENETGSCLERALLAFLVQTAGGQSLDAAAAAARTLGLLVDAQPGLEQEILSVLQRGLKHGNGAIRVASAEAIWIANGKASVDAIRDAAANERDARVRDYLLHAAQLLSGGASGSSLVCPELHVWFNGNDWIVAESAEDAEHLLCSFQGDVGPYDGDPFRQLAHDAKLRIWVDEQGRLSDGGRGDEWIELTMRQWIERYGRGYLVSSDY